MANPNADRNLLFGILALQMDFISRDALITAMHAWAMSKSKPLGQILLEQKALAEPRYRLLDALVQEHLKLHDNSPERSLAAVNGLGTVREDLEGIADPELHASLANVPTRTEEDDGTRSPLGAPTSAGQRFRVLRPHARGGLGIVSVALDEELHREVALKEIQSEHADIMESRVRFMLEAEITGGLEHPGIVPVYGLGHDSSGRPFYAMRFIRGNTLKEAIQKFHQDEQSGRDPGERTIALRQLLGRFLDVCNAIAYAHSRGVLHRDLKPGNVMLGQYGETLVVDWGLAKPLGQLDATATSMEGPLKPPSDSAVTPTQMGLVVGTPQYMSPEQAAGRLELLGPASDVYSLGATLYSLLTGKPPFDEPNMADILRKVQQGDFPPPRSVNRLVAPALEAICCKAMALRPEDRYPSPRALADDVEHWLADEPVSAYREPRLARLGRWARRHKGPVGATVGVLLATIAAVVGAVVLVSRHSAEMALEKAEKAVAQTEKWQTTLTAYHSEADGRIARIRALQHATDQSNVRQEILNEVEQIGKLREQATHTMQELGDSFASLVPEEERRWEERAHWLRSEAARWLAGIRLVRGGSVTLPEPPDTEKYPRTAHVPLVALRPDLKQMAMAYPGSTTLFLLDADGQVLKRLPIPSEFTRKAHKFLIESWSNPLFRHSHNWDQTPSSWFVYTAPDRLLYQVGDEALTWSLPDGQLQYQRGTLKQPPPPFSVFNAASDSFIATAAPFNIGVEVRDWEPDSRSALLWRPNYRRASRDQERLSEIAFGPDGRRLFVRSSSHLSLVDAATGMLTEQPVAGRRGESHVGKLIPYHDGVALVERPSANKQLLPPQLIYWNATLPMVEKRALLQDQPPRSMDWNADGTLLVGGGDHMLSAWRGSQRIWAAGVPFISEQVDRNVPDRPPSIVGPHDNAIGVITGLGGFTGGEPMESVVTANANWLREAWSEFSDPGPMVPLYRPPFPYRNWGFIGTENPRLAVERWELLPDGGSLPRFELYSPQDGKLVFAYPGEGKGRIASISPDRRFAAVVAEQKGTQVLIDLCELDTQKNLGRLGWYPLAPERPGIERVEALRFFYLSSDSQTKWLLISRPLHASVGADLEIWRLPEVKRVGLLLLPNVPSVISLAADETRAVVVRPRAQKTGPYYGQIVDLESARKVCDLQNFDSIGRLGNGFRIGSQLIYAVREGHLASDTYQISLWDERTGRRANLGKAIWSNTSPLLIPGPESGLVLILGTLHETGKAHVELWDLGKRQRLKAETYTTEKPPILREIQHDYFSFRLEDFPEKDRNPDVIWKWTDGTELPEAPSGGIRLLAWHRDILHNWSWLVWQDRTGAFVEDPTTHKRTRLEDIASPVKNTGFIVVGNNLLALEGQTNGLWDIKTGKRIFSLPGVHRHFGADATGRWLLSVDPATGEVLTRDLTTGKEALRFNPRNAAGAPFEPTTAQMKLDASGKRLAVISQGVFRLWDVEKNQPIATLPRSGHFSPVTCVAQHPAAGLVASAGEEGVILLWDRTSGILKLTLLAHPAAISAVAFHPEGRQLASLSGNTVRLQDVEGTGIWSTLIAPRDTRLTRLIFHPTGSTLFVVSEDGRLIALDGRNGKVQFEKTADIGITALALSPDGSLLALGCRGGQVHLLDVAGQKWTRKWNTYSAVAALTFIGNELLATGGQSIRFWESATGKDVLTLEVAHAPVRELMVNQKTGELAVADQGEKIELLNLPDLYHRLEELKLGVAAFPRGQWPVPAKRSEPAPRRFEDWQRKIDEYRRTNRWNLVAWACNRALDLHPEDWKTWLLRSESRSQPTEKDTEVLNGGLADVIQALALRKDDWTLYTQRARVHVKLRHWRGAIADFTRAIELHKDVATLWSERGDAHDELQHYDQAIADFTEAMRLDPKDQEAPLKRCESLRWKGEFDRVIAELEPIIKNNPHAAVALAVRSAAYRGKKDYAQALTDITEALNQQPRLAYAYAQRAELHRVQGKFDLALADIDEAITLSPRFTNAFLVRGVIFHLRGDLGRAVTEYSEAIRHDPEKGRLYVIRADAHAQRRVYDWAIKDYSEALRLGMNQPTIYFSRGNSRFFMKDYDGAIADFDEAIRREPKYAMAFNGRGRAKAEKGLTDQALADFNEATRLDPKMPFPFFQRGELHRSRREFDKAIIEYTRASELKQDHAESWQARGHAQAESGKWDRAASDFEKCLELVPANAVYRWEHALALLAAGDLKAHRIACHTFLVRFEKTSDAGIATLVAWSNTMTPGPVEDVAASLRLAQQAVVAEPGRYAVGYTFGAALYRAGKYEDAARQLLVAGKLHVDGSTAYDSFFLAMTYQRLGRGEEAKTAFNKGVQWIETGKKVNTWTQRAELDVLRREVESVLKK
jgi:tetratricopeptide (TPR) repeat protein/WD40 repeat protein/tRNA A-37 threonylcarbamoyl transferase component Bud32